MGRYVDVDFQILLETIDVPIMILDHNLKFVFANIQYCSATKKNESELLSKHVFEVFPDTNERITPIKDKFLAALRGETTYLNEEPYKLMREDGIEEDRVWQAVQTPYYASDGTVTHLIQRCDDVTEQVAMRLQRDIISNELDHRVRNMMAVIQAIANLTSSAVNNVDDFMDAFSGRLESVSRNFAQLSQGDWSGLRLQAILEEELNIYVGERSHRYSLSGPDTKLTIKSSKDAALIIHELATNAAKYGCLSCDTGHLNVSWSVEGSRLNITWAETGLSGIEPPARDGFGFSFLKMMPNMIVEKDFRPDGLRMQFSIPIKIAVDLVEIR